MAWDLRGSGNISSEQRQVKLESAIGSELYEQIAPPYQSNRPIIVPPPYKNVESHSFEQTAGLQQPDWQPLQMIGQIPENGFALGKGSFVGSNNWVIGGQHTASGLPLLANDPHLGVQLPSIWYWVGLHAPEIDVAGMSFAGVPGVIVGHNNHIAWGVTNMTADTQDLYIEAVNPDNPQQYLFEGNWHNMVEIEEHIQVNGSDPVTLTVLETVHGPILNTVDDKLDNVLSVRWAGLEPSRLIKAVLMLNHATNYEQFRDALSNWDTAGQNFVYADIDGNIAYQATGRQPIRPNWDGTTPVNGSGEYEWAGMILFDEMPARLNPPEGFIVTANNAVVSDEYPYVLAKRWAAGDRAQRITSLLEQAISSDEPISIETLLQIQQDNYELLFESYQPLLNSLQSDDTKVQNALDQMHDWDGQLNVDSIAATIFEVLLWKLTEQLLADDLGNHADEMIRFTSTTRTMLHNLSADLESPLWDNVTTDNVESADTIILLALEETVRWLEDNHGQNQSDWAWGNIHQIEFKSNPLGQSGIQAVESIVNRGPYAVDGGRAVVNANGFSWGQRFGHVISHASMRMIIDVSNWDASLAIHPTGQSGHPFHTHYSDMTTYWLSAEYHPYLFSDQSISYSTEQTLTLNHTDN